MARKFVYNPLTGKLDLVQDPGAVAAHAIGGGDHTASTIAALSTKVSDATLASTANIATHAALPDVHHVAFVQGDADLLYEPTGSVATHAALDTGIHGVGASTVASVADIATHAALADVHHVAFVQGDADLLYEALGAVATHSALDTGVHGAGASTLATAADIATHAALPNAHHVAFVQGDADLLYDPLGSAAAAVATHAALDTGIHGVGGSTIASVADIATHAALDTGVHGAGASTLATAADIATHSALNTGVHGVGASTIASAADIATHAALANVHHAQSHQAEHEIGGGDLVNHDSLTGFVANKHIDHTGVTFDGAANDGIGGGGTIAVSRTLSLDIDGMNEIGAALQDGDTFPMDDGDSGTNRKCLMSRVSTYIGVKGYVQAHAILDGSVHTDSVADDVTRGSLIYGNNTPKWDELVLGAVDTFLGSDGADLSYRTAAQVLASLSGEATATFSWNDQILSGVQDILAFDETLNVQLASAGAVYIKGSTTVDSDTKFLASFTGTDGATTAIDVSASAHTINFHGNAQIDTDGADPWGTNTGVLLLDGSGDRVKMDDSSDWHFTSDMTIDFWMKRANTTGLEMLYYQGPSGGVVDTRLLIQLGRSITNNNVIWFYDHTEGTDLSSSISITDTNWHHIALVRESGIITVYIDGVDRGSAAYVTPTNLAYSLYLGFGLGSLDEDLYFEGSLAEVRISHVARWSTGFTPPTAPYVSPTSADLNVQDDIIIGNGKFIGSAGDPDAIAIASDGKTTFTQDLTVNEDIIIGDGKFIGSASDPDAIQIEADGDVVMTQDLSVDSRDVLRYSLLAGV